MASSQIESRPHLELGEGIRAFGFRLTDLQRPTLTDKEAERILSDTTDGRFVAFDLRGAGYIPATVVDALIDLSRRLQRHSRLLIVLIDNGDLRAALRQAEITRFFSIVGDESELVQRLAELCADLEAVSRMSTTEAELASALASGGTLDDLIEGLERAS